ncbi:MAG: glycosyl hydrolase, partial [Planctomycetota bacterium]
AHLHFYSKEGLQKNQIATVRIADSDEQIIRTFSTQPDKNSNELPLTVKKGINRLTWDMRHNGAETFDGLVLWGGGTGGPKAIPGNYTATLSIKRNKENEPADNSTSIKTEFEILKDPRSTATQEDLNAQFDFLAGVRDKLSETHKAIKKLRDIKHQIDGFTKRLDEENDKHKRLIESSKSIVKSLTEAEEALYQTKNQAPQDPLNYPIRLNNRLSALVSVVAGGDNRPTDQSFLVRDMLIKQIDGEIEKLNQIVDERVSDFNREVRDAQIPTIIVNK